MNFIKDTVHLHSCQLASHNLKGFWDFFFLQYFATSLPRCTSKPVIKVIKSMLGSKGIGSVIAIGRGFRTTLDLRIKGHWGAAVMTKHIQIA